MSTRGPDTRGCFASRSRSQATGPGGYLRAADPPGRGPPPSTPRRWPRPGRRLRRHERHRPRPGRRAGQGRDLLRPLHQGHLPDDPPVVEVRARGPGAAPARGAAGARPQAAPAATWLRLPLCSLLRAGERHGPYDVLHSHYWVSGWRWPGWPGALGQPGGPLLPPWAGSRTSAWPTATSPSRRPGRRGAVVAAADRLLAAHPARAPPVELYGASPAKVSIVPRGVDRTRFHPGDRAAARAALGVAHRHVLAFVAGSSRSRPPTWPSPAWPPCASSGPTWTSSCWWSAGPRATAAAEPARLHRLAAANEVAGRVRFPPPPRPHDRLATVYRAADLVLMPSWSSRSAWSPWRPRPAAPRWSQPGSGACCTPSATAPPGSCWPTTSPRPGRARSPSSCPAPAALAAMGAAAARFAGAYGWDVAAARLIEIYGDLVRGRCWSRWADAGRAAGAGPRCPPGRRGAPGRRDPGRLGGTGSGSSWPASPPGRRAAPTRRRSGRAGRGAAGRGRGGRLGLGAAVRSTSSGRSTASSRSPWPCGWP